MPRNFAALAVLTALSLPVLALAQGPAALDTRSEVETKVRAKFTEIDADRDGFVTRAEATRYAGVPAAGGMRRQDDVKGEGGGAAVTPRPRIRVDGLMMLRMADTDKDGRVSLREAVGGSLALFDRADTNKDGKLTDAERAAARPMLREQVRRMRPS